MFDNLDWGQLAAQAMLIGSGVTAVTYLVRNAMSTYWTKLELQGQKLVELEKRIDLVDRRNEKGDQIHEEHADRITRTEEGVKDAHKRLDRAGG